uniref:Uncharacterized protein n=1 Tax=Anopheles christyi TaxID=43041 RepID=A0A182JQG4_9DIPT
MEQIVKMVCNGKNTYVVGQLLFTMSSHKGNAGLLIKCLSQEVTKYAQKNNHDVIPVIMALNGSSRYPQVADALIAMLSRNGLDVANVALCPGRRPTHLALLDEVASHHEFHGQIMQLLMRLFESHRNELEAYEQLKVMKILLDRMVHLLVCGYVLPVVKYLRKCYSRCNTDMSLIRYFVKEVLDVVTFPYSKEFVELFLPLVSDSIIVDRNSDLVSEFIVNCMANY